MDCFQLLAVTNASVFKEIYFTEQKITKLTEQATIYRFRTLDLELLGVSVKNAPNQREWFLMVTGGITACFGRHLQ